MSENDIPAFRVHIASSDVHGAPPRRRTRRAVYLTVTLGAADPCLPVLPKSANRKAAFIIALDQAVTLNAYQADAANGVGTIVPQNVAWPVEDDRAVFAGAAGLTGATTARVSVHAVYEDGG
jgi:hypothetical protein